MTNINSDSLNIDDRGRVTFSGASSGIDSRAIIDATISARRLQAVQFENNIDNNNLQIEAFGELDTLATTLTGTLDALRGSTSFFSNNVFDTKVAAGNSRLASNAPAGTIASNAANLISAAVTSDAANGSNTFQVNQLAQANQIRSDAFTSATDTLISQGVALGDFSINGRTVNVDDDDTLLNLSSKINSANAGVTASVITASPTQNFLVITANDTGVENAIQINGSSNTATTVTNTTTTNIAFNNASFEADIVADGGSQSSIAEFTAINATVENPTTSDYPSGIPNGTNVATLTTGGSISQSLSETIQPGADYRITLSAGRRSSEAQGTYEIRLFAGDTQVASQTGIDPAASGAFNLGLLEVDAATLSGFEGEQLRVEIAHITGGNIDIDNVQVQRDTFTTSTQSVADSINPNNASFENDLSLVPNDGNFLVGVDGFQTTGGNAATVNAATADFAGEASDGELIATLTAGKTIFQDLNAEFNSNNTYNVSIDVGNRAPVGGTSNFAVRLFAGNTLVGETTGTSTLGSLNTINLSVDGSAFAAANGEQLRFEVANISGAELALDNINISAASAATSLGFLNSTGGIKNELSAAQDANLTVNGIEGVTRASNEVDDLFEGVTLSLLQADANTEVTIEISPDLNAIKNSITDFALAFNDLRDFIDDQALEIDRDEDGEAEFGSLNFDSTLRQVASRLSDLVGTEITSLEDGFRSLGQIGVELNSDFRLEINDEVIDNRLLTNVEGLRDLFEIGVTSSDSRVQLINRSDETVSGDFILNIGATDANGNILSANINGPADGSDDGSVTINGRTITATDATPANGLVLLFNGADNLGNQPNIGVNVSRGIADLFFDDFNGLTRIAGTFDTRIADLEEQNTDAQDRIDTIDERLEITRQTLERQFIALETALAQLESLREQITSLFAENDDS